MYWGMGHPELQQAWRNIPSSLNDRDFSFLPGWGSRLILGSPTAVLLPLKTPALGYLLQLYRLNSKPAPGRHSQPRPRVEHMVVHNIRMHRKPLLTYRQRSELVPWRGQLCLQPPSLLRLGVTFGGMQGHVITEIIIWKNMWNEACLMNYQKQAARCHSGFFMHELTAHKELQRVLEWCWSQPFYFTTSRNVLILQDSLCLLRSTCLRIHCLRISYMHIIHLSFPPLSLSSPFHPAPCALFDCLNSQSPLSAVYMSTCLGTSAGACVASQDPRP